MNLKGQDALAFEYATSIAGVSGSTASAEEVAATVTALVEAPAPSELEPNVLDSRLGRVLEEWEQRYGNPSDEEDGIAAVAQRIASDILASLGFEWV